MQATTESQPNWLERSSVLNIRLKWEVVIFAVIIILAVFSRFYDLGARVMSHDENTHVYYSWRFERGQGLQHDPLMHGPFQFHLIALSYFMFGDNDFTARIPAALFSIASVAFLWYFRRYLGRTGVLVGAVLMLISPYILYYGRYVRNEVFSVFFGIVMLWGILRYLELGTPRYLYIISVVTALHFTAKETSFIYQAQAMVFLAFYLIYQLSHLKWRDESLRNLFLLSLIFAFLMIIAFGGISLWLRESQPPLPVETGAPATPGTELGMLQNSGPPWLQSLVLALAVVGLVAALYFLIVGYGWRNLCNERSFGLLILLGTMVLPQLAPFPVRLVGKLLKDPVGWSIPTNASQVASLNWTQIGHIALFLVPLTLLAVAIGLLWNPREWLINAGVFYGIFTVIYTSVFTNEAGFFTGLVGSLGYWLEQQGVQRGSQPWYYYGLVQIPVYEYLSALGCLLALGMVLARGVREWFGPLKPHKQFADWDDTVQPEPVEEAQDVQPVEWERTAEDEALSQALDELEARLVEEEDAVESEADMSVPAENRVRDEPSGEASVHNAGWLPQTWSPVEVKQEPVPMFALLFFWVITSLVAYSLAGEKMPWLTAHIAFPMILCTAWGLGQQIDAIDWAAFRERKGWLLVVVTMLLMISLVSMFGAILGLFPPFEGQLLEQLQTTSEFVVSALVAVASAVALAFLLRSWEFGQLARLSVVMVFALFGILTARTAIQSSYINYDNANELLVYAHSAGGVKVALSQIEEISMRTTNGLNLPIAYDDQTSYPYWWYLRNYTDVRYFGSKPTRSLREVSAILVGDSNFSKIEPVVGNAFYQFDYIRLWWPNQDYFGLTPERVLNALRDRQMRAAIFQIWLNRDYTKYGEAVGREISLANWSPAARMRLYIRKDVAAQIWNYGIAASPEVMGPEDPFEEKRLDLVADQAFGLPGNLPGQFQRPRDLALAADGSLYIADTDNHRIQHVRPDGTVLQVWGSYGDVASDTAAEGTFNQPWGIAVGPDGSVYVADTWNHRVQRFTAEGAFVYSWGYFGQAEEPDAFWGPRDVAVDRDGRVFVSDTGNKRVVVFDADGNYLTQFGTVGVGPGEFDEPVGLALDDEGRVFVADTWNQRIQVFVEGEDGRFRFQNSWDVVAWFGQSLDNKPYMAVDSRNNLLVVDPEGYRVLWFSANGDPLNYWGDYGVGLNQFGMPASVVADPTGGVWVSDAGNGRIMHFVLPAQISP
ncbi:MAG: flippase activity-associated protein Agl23 [Chloroflexota bacterium]